MSADPHAVPEAVRVGIQTDSPAGGSHDVLIGPGLAAAAGDLIGAARPAHRYAVITDSNVGPLHGSRVVASLEKSGLRADIFTFAAGETSKSRAVWADLTDALLDRGHARDSCVVVVGGGVAGDLGGFVAATFMRGIPWVNVPTTLLAMLDSAVGGKTGVDTAAGKNLVGAFHQPALVIMDPDTLATLPGDAYRASLAEAVKHGAIADSAYFDWIEANAGPLIARNSAALAKLIRRSVELKGEVVVDDTLEAGRRAILNFGHTIGHAIERATDYRISHGHAVSIGMVTEARIGEAMGVTESGTAAGIARCLAAFGLPVDLRGLGLDPVAVLEATRSDKKARGSAVRYALVSRVGACHRGTAGEWTHVVPDDLIRVVTAAGPGALSQAGTEF